MTIDAARRPLTPTLSPTGERGRKRRSQRVAGGHGAVGADIAPSPLAAEGRGEGAARAQDAAPAIRTPSAPLAPPLPLAGEGWGEGLRRGLAR